jgi:hypothetical protein
MPDTQDNSIQNYKIMYPFALASEIAFFYEYLNTLDKNFEHKKRKLSVMIDVTDTNLNELGSNTERLNELENQDESIKEFTNLLRQSFLTSLYSFMELWLLRDCYHHSKLRDDGKSFDSIKDKGDKGIDQAKQYFTKIMKVDYSFDGNQDWIWIKNLQKLRHCIIHRQGSLTGFSDREANPALVQFINNENDLSLFGVNDNQVFIEYKFCLKALVIIHRVMSKLLA